MNLYHSHNEGRTPLSVEKISRVLRSIAIDYSRIYILVDALDECQTSNGGRRRLLSEIFNLQIEGDVCFFATSRFIPEIQREFAGQGSISIEISASDDDVQRYLNGHMSQLPSFVSRSSNLQEEIKTEIMEAVNGMYVLPLHTSKA